MVILPNQYSEISTYDLLQADGKGRIGFDHRVLRVGRDRGEQALRDLVRVGTRPPDEGAYDVSGEPIAIFRHLRDPAAMPFFVEYIRRGTLEVSEDLNESLRPLGDAVVS